MWQHRVADLAMLKVAAVVASVPVTGDAATSSGWERRTSFWLQRFPEGTVLYYPRRKLTIRGARSVEMAEQGLADAAKSLCVEAKGPPSIHNIVFQAELPRGLNLEALMLVLDNATYEPEIFPGLIFKTGQGSETVLAFSSGKAIVTGLRTADDAERVWAEFLKAIEHDLG